MEGAGCADPRCIAPVVARNDFRVGSSSSRTLRALASAACSIAIAAFACSTPPRRVEPPASAQRLGTGDRERAQSLFLSGHALTRPHVVAWFPDDALAPAREGEIADRLERGVIAARLRIGTSPRWSNTDRRIVFLFHDSKFISHAPTDEIVLIPLWRMRDQQAPWIHEVLHTLLVPRAGDWLSEAVTDEYANANMPLWLMEGLADHLAQVIATENGLDFYSPFDDGGLERIDETCRERLEGPNAQAVLAYIGRDGRLPELFGPDRFEYASVFYPCANSFVKYLDDTYGIEALLASNAAFDHEREQLEKSLGVSLETARASWLAKVRGSSANTAEVR